MVAVRSSPSVGPSARYELADPRLAHALIDLMGVVLTVDPQHCAEAARADRVDSIIEVASAAAVVW